MGFWGKFGKTLGSIGKATVPIAINEAAHSIPGAGAIAGIVGGAIAAAKTSGGSPQKQSLAAVNFIFASAADIATAIEQATGKELVNEVKFQSGINKIVDGIRDLYGAVENNLPAETK